MDSDPCQTLAEAKQQYTSGVEAKPEGVVL